jgi:hypothetical protein
MIAIVVRRATFDLMGTSDEPNWVPLEEILSSCLEMIEQRRVTASCVFDPFGNWIISPDCADDTEIHPPWALTSEYDSIVEITIAAWDDLLSAIGSRLPEAEKQNYKTYDRQIIDSCKILSPFIEKFLQRARIPQGFQFIAPGLRVAAPEELSTQPFKDTDLKPRFALEAMRYRDFKWYPFLFLRADGIIHSSEGRYNDYPWEQMSSFSTGLYLDSTQDIQRPDGCKLLLPFSLKSARFGDGKFLNKKRDYDGLYQPGWDMFVVGGKLRLELLFKNWTEMIKNGHWVIDENGVKDGIEKFKEAETVEQWQLYWIKRTW